MDSNELIRNLKLIVLIAVIIGFIGAVLYLLYGFTILWQAMAAGIITGFLSLLLIIFVVVSIYLWTKNLLLKRDVKRYKMQLSRCKAELKKNEQLDNQNIPK
jgi:hypothetical protein